MSNLHEDEQIVTENAVLADAAAQALQAARRAVQRWAHEREAAAQYPQQQNRRVRRENKKPGLLQRIFGRKPAQQTAPVQGTELEQVVAKWASRQASAEYANHIAKAWNESVAEADKEMIARGLDPDKVRALASRSDIDVERVKALAVQFTRAELDAARAIQLDTTPAAAAPAVAPAAKAAAAKKAPARAAANGQSTSNAKNTKQGPAQASTANTQASTAGAKKASPKTAAGAQSAGSGKTASGAAQAAAQNLVNATQPQGKGKGKNAASTAPDPQQQQQQATQAQAQASQASAGAGAGVAP